MCVFFCLFGSVSFCFPHLSMSATKEPTKRLVVRGVGEARPMLPRSITLASSSLTPASFHKEFRNVALNPMPPKLEHAVDPKSEDRVMKDVPVPEPYRLARNALFDDNGVPVIPLIRSHFVKEGLRFVHFLNNKQLFSQDISSFFFFFSHRTAEC